MVDLLSPFNYPPRMIYFIYKQSEADFNLGVTVRYGADINYDVALRRAKELAKRYWRVYVVAESGQLIWDSRADS